MTDHEKLLVSLGDAFGQRIQTEMKELEESLLKVINARAIYMFQIRDVIKEEVERRIEVSNFASTADHTISDREALLLEMGTMTGNMIKKEIDALRAEMDQKIAAKVVD